MATHILKFHFFQAHALLPDLAHIPLTSEWQNEDFHIREGPHYCAYYFFFT